MADSDVIDTLAGIAPGSPLDAIRARRPEARLHAQASFRALFSPDDPGNVSPQDRFALASFVAGVHGQPGIAAFYQSGLVAAGVSAELAAAVQAEAAAAMGDGPFGEYPPGPLSREDTPGHVYRVGSAALGARLAAAFEHAHLLVFHPRDSAPRSLQALLDAGWTVTDVVTLSQIVAFLSYQIRAIAGLRGLAARPSNEAT